MPFVNVRTARGLLSPAKKQELQTRLTDLLVEIEGGADPEFARFVMVLVEEHDADAWCVHGNVLNDDAIRALAAASAARSS